MGNLENQSLYFYFRDDMAMNYTSEDMCKVFEYEYSFVMYGVLFPILVIATFFTNLLIICVFTMSKIRSPTTTLLTGLAVSDSLAGLVMMPLFIIFYSDGSRNGSYILSPLCYYHLYAYKLTSIFHATSVWITTALAAQRFAVITFPMKGKRFCVQQTSCALIGLIYILAFMLHIPWFLGDTIEVVPMLDPNNNDLDVCFCIKLNDYEVLMKLLRLTFVQILPCIILVITTVSLVRQLIQETNRILRLHADDDDEGERKDFRHVRRTTIMIVLIVVGFLSVEIPYAIIFALDSFKYFFKLSIEEYEREKLKIAVFINFFTYLNYHINFWIYVSLSKLFRKKLKTLLGFDRIGYCNKKLHDSHTRTSHYHSNSACAHMHNHR